MFKRIFAVAAVASLSMLGATAAAQAQAPSTARPVGHLHGVRVVNLHRAYEAQLRHIKVGEISGIVYAKGHRPKATANAAASCTTEPCPVAWQGGTVQHTPHVYLLFWGPNWQTDPAQEASATYLERFFSGLGNGQADDNWSTITSQYADATGAPSFGGLVYEGAFNDPTTPHSNTSLDQIGAEADSFIEDQQITDVNDAQVIVATQSGTCPQGFIGAGCTGGILQRNECGYHSSSNQPFINLPYVLDAGRNCGKDAVNPAPGGDNDGWSIVGGDLYASTITDPFPPTGWVDPNDGSEISGKCSADFNLTLTPTSLPSPAPFAVQTQWSNAANACVPTGAITDTIKITNPGSQTSSVNTSVNLAIVGTSTAGNPLAWSATGLPNGLNINASTGAVTGTPTTPGTFGVAVTAKDETGAKKSVSFSWTINQAGKPITGDHGKCLDDFGSGTTNGNKVDIWTCNNTPAQQWTFSGGELSVLGKCLDDASQGGAGAPLVVWTCNGHAAQIWTHKSNGEYVLKLNGMCLTDPSGSSTDGTQVVVRTCASFADQTWTLPS